MTFVCKYIDFTPQACYHLFTRNYSFYSGTLTKEFAHNFLEDLFHESRIYCTINWHDCFFDPGCLWWFIHRTTGKCRTRIQYIFC